MQIDAKMIFDKMDNERTESEVLMKRTQVQTGTKRTVNDRDTIEQQALRGCQSTTTRKTNQKLTRVSNKMMRWNHKKETQFLWECYERSCFPLSNGYMLGCNCYELVQGSGIYQHED